MPIGSLVTTVKAKDPDKGENGRITYSIRAGDGLGSFYIDSAGNIKTLVNLDRESKAFYWLTVYAMDNGAIPLATKLYLYLEVLDVNDNVPLTEEPIYFASVRENSKPFSPILTLKAFDGDNSKHTKLSYEIVSGNPQSLFHIDPLSGIISTTKRILDRETQEEHVLEVQVSDNGKPSLNSTTRVVISVKDENDNAPEFLERYVKLNVPETLIPEREKRLQNDQNVNAINNKLSSSADTAEKDYKVWEEMFENSTWESFDYSSARIGKPLFSALASDRDVGDNGDILFSMKTEGQKGKLQIDRKSGIVYAIDSIMAGEQFDILLKATDGGKKSALGRVSITVQPVDVSEKNAHPPTILTIPPIQVFESDEIGHLVALVDAQDIDGDRLWFSIISGNEDNTFNISPDRGSILLARKLDFRRQWQYELTVLVTDGKYETKAPLTISVLEVSDRRPEFPAIKGGKYEIDVFENVSLDKELIQLSVSDKYRRKPSFAFHAAQELSSLSKFNIDPSNGIVTVKAKLDRERTNRHIFTVSVKDQGSLVAQLNYARLIINVLDHNDHAPKFLSELIQTKLLETSAVGMEVLEVIAVDNDKGENGRISYSIASGNVGNTFTIDEELGVIKVSRPLDLSVQGEYTLLVKANDNGEPSLSSTVPVHILLTMSEDVPPRLSKPHFATEVYEDQEVGSFIIQVKATARSMLKYDIIEGNEDSTFVINPSNGIVMNQKYLDFEKQHLHNLTVSVSNAIGMKVTCSVHINVLDINDNEPYFEANIFRGKVSESASVGSLVLLENHTPLVIKSNDADSGVNSLMQYQIQDAISNQFFAIDESTGAIRTIRDLDFEVTKKFEFLVSLSDRGIPRLSSAAMAKVVVDVLDENDSPPVFTKKEHVVLLLLPTFENVAVIRVEATDPDSIEKTKLRYSLVNGNEDGRFRINSTSGAILIAKENEMARSLQYTLEVAVSDGKFTDRCIVHVQVEKSDNSGLAFAQEKYEAKVLENTTKANVIVILAVLGYSLNENLRFSILNPTDFFTIGETSGAIRTTGIPFDREVQEVYHLVAEVRSEDHSRVIPRVARVEVEVTILDMNDNAPVFVNQPYHAVMSKDLVSDSPILKVSAIDLDKDENGEVYYQLVKGNGELFRVGRQSGQITLRQSQEIYEKEYKMTIAAYDGGTPPFSEETVVAIKVIDNSIPVFSHQFYKAKVKEDIEPYSPVISVRAEGPVEEGKLIYTIESGNEEESFAVDYNSGAISVIDKLDFEKKPHHQLTLRATDGVNGGYAEAIVLLGVEDVNDCKPEFSDKAYQAVLSESVPVDHSVLTVKATDADSGMNQEISYSLLRDRRNDSDFFSIDADSGELFVKIPLDHEKSKVHRFVIVARDKGVNSLSSTVTATVFVLDANDNKPEFEEAKYFMRLSDKAERGQIVGKVRAVDPDDSDQTNLVYKIIGGNQHQIFSINETNGIIKLVNLHNFDQNSEYEFNVSVSDGVYSGYSKVQVALYSANSFTPRFDESPVIVTFPENQPEGVRVAKLRAFDEDRGDEITYSIQSQELTKLFNMDPYSGEIWSRTTFDRETTNFYEIPVVATDSGGKNGLGLVKVSIGDANDNKPSFQLSEYKANIFANLTVGSEVLIVTAIDKDVGRNAKLSYSIYENKTSGISKVFQIDRLSGQISLKINAAGLSNQIYQFFVRANDGGYPTQLHADVPVEIYIMSPLDQPPFFKNKEKVYFINENSPIGQVIASIYASTGENQRDDTISYSIASADYVNVQDPLFVIGKEDGKLIVNGHLDREMQSIIKLTVMASTDASPSLNAYFDLSIQILDKNDNAPSFHSVPYVVKVSEAVSPHTQIVQLVATDADHSNNGEIRFAFSEKSMPFASVFSLDTHDGLITTQDNLDFEKTRSYELEVVARDNGSPRLSSLTTVQIELIDYNDNPTKFSQRHYAAAINEGAPSGNIIFQLETEDLDKVAQQSVEFYIVDGDQLGQFQVKTNGELYVSRPLDRETKSNYRLEVIATDGFFVSTCLVTIEILDDNDSPPICKEQIYKRSIEENASSETFLLHIEATDDDVDANSKQIFYLSGENSDFFSIDRLTGQLRTVLPLDREKIDSFSLEVHVQDEGMPEWECTTRVEIEVLDSNDNAPEWSQKVFSATMKEDLPVGTVVTKIHAVDADIGRNKQIDYFLLDSAEGSFRLDPYSGIVTLAKPLDREQQAMYNLTVRAMDKGRPRLSTETNVIVMILDVNDNPPEFASKSYFASISEDTSVGADVVRVLATSKDTGINADITYSIIGGNELRKFKINPKSGMIMVADRIDFEKSADFFLTIQAQDGGDPPLSNHATANITIEDANDNSPVFTQVSYSALINEAVPTGHNVVSVTANDLDSDENGKISYSLISGDRHNQFSIDPSTGMIFVASALDREMISSYVLEVRGADNGRPKALSSTVLVTVDISDANDNSPIFPEGNYTAYVQEDKPIDFIVQRFTVSDADDTPNGAPFTFDIRGGNVGNAFRIVQDGTLRTAINFDHKKLQKYVLQIRVFDNGTPPMFSDSFVIVNIIEQSRYAPQVDSMTIEVSSYQDDFPGAIIGQVRATDMDKYDTLQYALNSGYQFSDQIAKSHLFEIDKNNGNIFAVQGLDAGSYNLNVSVTDGKFSSFSMVKVQVNAVIDSMLEHAMVMRFRNILPKQFFTKHQNDFKKLLKNVLKVKAHDIEIISIQAVDKIRSVRQTMRRDVGQDSDVLFVVHRDSKDGLFARDKLHFLFDQSKLNSQLENIGLDLVELPRTLCADGTCGTNGKCKDIIVMGEEVKGVTIISSKSGNFIAPKFKRDKVCQCQDGFAGERCEVILNECARRPCPTFKLCVPDSSFQGYQCHCPSGLTGALCNVNVTSCGNAKCNIVNPMNFGGKSYAQYKILDSIERRLSLSLGFKTRHPTGNIMYAVGMVDYSVLEIVNGKLRYRFNFGSGEGLVTLNDANVNDGDWHELSLERHGNQAKISLDNGLFEEHGSAPGVNDVLNIEDGMVYFGAEVVLHQTSANGEDINKGFSGCLDDLRLDGVALPLHLHGSSPVAKLKRFNNVEFRCGELTPPGACGSHPCHNGGTCQEQSGSYFCSCLSRFTGTHCEYDLDPCASSPCLYGSNCLNLKNDFHCECPPKLSGKRCHYGKFCNPNPCMNGGICEEDLAGPICKCRGFTGNFCTIDINECLHQNPCHNGGTCINSNGGFHCVCPAKSTGLYCSELYDATTPRRGRQDFVLKLEEVVAIICSLFIIVFILIMYVFCKKFKLKQRGQNSASYHIQNDFDKQESVRLNHHRNGGAEGAAKKLNNVDLASQERPLLPTPRPASCYAPNHPLQQQETAFTYNDTVRSYGSAADELENLPKISQDYIQNIKKPMAAVAPSVCNPAEGIGSNGDVIGNSDRNLMGNYFYPEKLKGGDAGDHRHPARLRVNLPPVESPAMKGAASLSSLQTSVADNSSQRYFWDSFDLNNENSSPSVGGASASEPPVAGAAALPRLSMVPEIYGETNTSTLPPRGKPVDPSRDIETLNEDELQSTTNDFDAVSNADTEDEPQLGSVYPKQPMTKSFEELLALNEDINFADADEEDSGNGLARRDFHLNNYLPTYHVSETDTDEQTPMLSRHNNSSGFGRYHPAKSSANGKASNNQDTSSELNTSIAALPEDDISILNGSKATSDLDNLCELEDSEDDTPTVEVKPMNPLNPSRVTRV